MPRVALFLVLSLAQQFGAHLDGRALPQLAAPGASAVVFFFVASDCPVSNRTFPEMKRLRERYAAQGVRFWFVYPNATERRGEVLAHQRDYDAGGEAITDPDAALVRLTHAFVTPEAAILVPQPGGAWKAVYTGRIDDRFVRIGQERPAPTQFFVENALRALLSGQPVAPDTGTPVGCTILPAKAALPTKAVGR